MKRLALVAAVLLALGPAMATSAHAAPFCVIKDVPAGATHCGIYMDAAPKVQVPVISVPVTAEYPTGWICKHDLANLPSGAHTCAGSAIIIADALWGGPLESPKSPPFAFTRPGVPAAPASLGLSP